MGRVGWLLPRSSLVRRAPGAERRWRPSENRLAAASSAPVRGGVDFVPITVLPPDRRLLCPRDVLKPRRERPGSLLQRSGIPRRLVRSDARPVKRLRCRVGLVWRVVDLSKLPLRLRPLLLLKGHARTTEHQLGEQVVGRQKAFDAVLLDCLGIEQEDRRGPRRLV